ncbi:hypothetical protein ADMFC3_13850 [Geovibrio sp. ADMFC3]|jgi:hypothetical protein|nr:hypothetical protein [Deferribacteraceae bacterium]
MFNKIKGLISKGERKRSFRRASGGFRLCITVLKTDKKTGLTEPSTCFIARVHDYSAGGLCIFHNNNLLEGEEVEIGNKHSMKKLACLKCPNMPLTADSFASDIIRGRVAWRTHKLCGIQFTSIRKTDEKKINDMALDKVSGGK